MIGVVASAATGSMTTELPVGTVSPSASAIKPMAGVFLLEAEGTTHDRSKLLCQAASDGNQSWFSLSDVQ